MGRKLDKSKTITQREKYDIVKFEKVEKKITKPITKFGGQPIGIKESQWPISKSWNDRNKYNARGQANDFTDRIRKTINYNMDSWGRITRAPLLFLYRKLKGGGMEIFMEMINWLQDWYSSNCDGDWEHMFGIKIDTLDNPGWRVSIDLSDTPLEDKIFEEREHYINDSNWFFCIVKDGIFQGRGDPNKLQQILKIFREWAEEVSFTPEYHNHTDGTQKICWNK